MKREAQEWGERMEDLARQHLQELNSREEELRKVASEKSGLTGALRVFDWAAYNCLPFVKTSFFPGSC